MLPDRVSNPGPLTYESGALPIALRSPAILIEYVTIWHHKACGVMLNSDPKGGTVFIQL